MSFVATTQPRRIATYAALAVTIAVIVAIASATFAPAHAANYQRMSYKPITVARVIDGDTVKLANGSTVRLIGIDTPEKGQCGYKWAKKRLTNMIEGKKVWVYKPIKGKDHDQYGRKLRYLQINGQDMSAQMIKTGWANARYDSVDGYPWHPRERTYRQLDKSIAHKCGSKVDRIGEKKASTSTHTKTTTGGTVSTGTEPWNQPGPDLDCSDIGKRVKITGVDYHRLDADGDGWGCDSYA